MGPQRGQDELRVVHDNVPVFVHGHVISQGQPPGLWVFGNVVPIVFMVPGDKKRLLEIVSAPIEKAVSLITVKLFQRKRVSCKHQHVAHYPEGVAGDEHRVVVKLQVQVRCVLNFHERVAKVLPILHPPSA